MKKFFKDFKAFISRGNVLDMAVGVVIGGAFSAIVTALVNILLSVCTWAVPGGLKGLVTVLPAANSTQEGLKVVANINQGNGQIFSADMYNDVCAAIGADAGITDTGSAMIYGKGIVDAKYTLHGSKFVYNLSATIDWGTFINSIITFLIIAFTLFIIVRVAMASAKKREEMKAKIEAEKYKKWAQAHPEEAAELEAKKAAEVAAGEEPAAPTNDEVMINLLTEIRDSLKKDEKPAEAKAE